MSWALSGILTIILIILIIKYNKKVILDKTELQQFSHDVKRLQAQKNDLQKDIEAQQDIIEEYNDKILKVQQLYKQEFNKKNEDLESYFNSQKLIRQSEIDNNFEQLLREKEENFKIKYIEYERAELEKEHKFRQEVQENIDAALENQQTILSETEFQQKRYEGLLAPLKQYEMDKQQRLFYTIQVPDEYKEDIDFLLNTVSQKVRHPDIINKLVWAEYVKPYIDETFKRIEIKPEPGIYKLTNIESGKAYIGKSTDVKKRISDHIKSSIGISSIADQAVHHAILETGFWNWTIEIIAYCEKDKLSELEKYYIDFFKTQEFGFNKREGG